MQQLRDKSLDCVHCGLCLSACPTYLATGRETSSPRGRVYLMRGVGEGEIDLGALLVEEAFLCLDCRACETACPSGVEYGSMVELTRAAIEEAGLRRGWRVTLERWILRHLVPRPGRLRSVVGVLAALRRWRVEAAGLALLGRIPRLGGLARSLRDASQLVPDFPPAAARAPLPAFVPAQGERRGRVTFFVGCLMPELFGEVHRASIRVLAANGFDVEIPEDQGCCGALLAHRGDLDFARELARTNIGAFQSAEEAPIVVNAAGCGAALRGARQWLPGEADAFSGRVRDIAEFLYDVGLRSPLGSVDARVCYDDPCHLLHAQGVSAAPRELLRSIPGLELVPHADPERCCGAAGIYNLTHAQMSREILDQKMDALALADPEIIASGNPGCLMQLRSGVERRGLRAQVVHPIELLDRAYGGTGTLLNV
jgi:glycolate oxidase iron-sulfur subunit